MPKEYYTVGTFRSSSRGNVWYRVNRDEEGKLSCTCPGWCRRVARDGSRSCKHIKKVEAREETEGRATRAAPSRPSQVTSTPTRSSLGERRFRL